MEALNRARRPLRNEVKRAMEKIKKLLEEVPVDKAALRVPYRMFVDTYNTLSAMDHQAMKQLVEDEATEEQQDEEFAKIWDIREKVETLRLSVDDLCSLPLQQSEGSDANTSVVGESDGIGYRLPKVEFKKFGGDRLEWLSFWAQFRKIDQHPKLDGSEKFGYLLMYLEEGSEAHETVKVFQQNNESYLEAIKALKRRYANEEVLLQVYIREILKLVISNGSSKEKLPLANLFTSVDSNLRALKTLNLTSADPDTWLYPLVESCLPDDTLLTWQRSDLAKRDGSSLQPPKTKLDLLLEFMGTEVDIRRRLEMAKSGFQSTPSSKEKPSKRRFPETESGPGAKPNWGKKFRKGDHVPTLTGFQNVVAPNISCMFCKRKGHVGVDCIAARRMTWEERKKIAVESRLCFNCLGKHIAKHCKGQYRCLVCGGRHCTVMCRKLMTNEGGRRDTDSVPATPPAGTENVNSTRNFSNTTQSSQVALQTLQVLISNGNRQRTVRVFLDSGSQRSYILKTTAENLKLQEKGAEVVRHELFGGSHTEKVVHRKYDIRLKSLVGDYTCELEVRDQTRISNAISRVSGAASQDLMKLIGNGATFTDVGEGNPAIDILIGADFYGHLLTGRVISMPGGAIAVETKLGWTLVGATGEKTFVEYPTCTTEVSMAVADFSVSQLWDLDTIGVRDESDVKNSIQEEMEAKDRFIQDISRDEEGRYVVKLPWRAGHPPLPSNKEVAYKRLTNTTKKLQELGLMEVYGKLFKDWEAEGFIEEVFGGETGSMVHYIPHRAVIKPGSLTTPVRPVFDASCRVGKSPSLNDSLHKGTNYILLIPEILLRFREKKIGFTADIRKAFQMIVVDEADRDAMRFLWWDDNNQIREYRHRRVMFGATCSPFILGAIIEYHLTHTKENEDVRKKLLLSMYVDNCLHSEACEEDYTHFRDISTKLLAECQMDLRMWLSNVDGFEDPATHTISTLGMQWDRKEDILFVKADEIKIPEKITKRVVLSVVQKLFDPVGVICPATIPVKNLLQRTWVNKLKWDEELPKEESEIFLKWAGEVEVLQDIKIPRRMNPSGADRGSWELHTFTDASKIAYAAVVYLRAEKDGVVSIQLLSAKSRVSPVKLVTIPRLELLGCLVGARLCATVKRALSLEGVRETYWTDSTTALAWIQRDDKWRTFVGNRTTEINRLTRKEDWVHVPGSSNPADLPSRGCNPSDLLRLRWWQGPSWLYEKNERPEVDEPINEEEVIKELRESVGEKAVVSMSVLDFESKESSFRSNVRIVAWMRRFFYNCQHQKSRMSGRLTSDEIVSAEQTLIYWIQKEAFTERGKESFHGLEVFLDDSGLLYVKTRVVERKDLVESNTPLLLPGNHPLVRQLIKDCHEDYCHAGIGFLVTKLRQKYWILHARKTIRGVVSRCVRCRRFAAKPIITETAPLPLDRIKDAEVFEVVGVDLAGPMILKNGKKVWMVIITCAVYRALYLDLVDSLSTNAFIKCLGNFVEKYRRPAIIYSDNGTNFRGSARLFRALDWKAIENEERIQPIIWKFSPPSGPWWGGWWERLIRTVKDLLRRTVGKASLHKGELVKTLRVIQDVMNGRPLTYVAETTEDLEPLTPNMFMKLGGVNKFPEGCLTEGDKMRCRLKYMETLWKELKQRFQKEYLTLLVSKSRKRPTRPLRVGELVVLGNEQHKRLEWPLGRILELYPGKDGVVRVAKVKVADGELVRPVQRLHPLELDAETGEGHQMQTRLKAKN